MGIDGIVAKISANCAMVVMVVVKIVVMLVEDAFNTMRKK